MSADRPVDFGTKLREARERRGVSLRAIADATKISVAVLEALERNDVSRLPGGIFSRAFIRSYALEVGLDPDETIHEFVAQFPHDAAAPSHEMMSSVGHAALESERHPVRKFLGLVGVGLPLAAAVLYFGMQRANRPVDPPPAAAKPEPSSLARESVPLTPEPQTQASTSTPPPSPAPAAPSAEPAATPPKSDAGTDDALTIVVSARRRCYVSATVDGKKAIEQLLPENDRRTLEVRKEMVLTVGDAAAIVMTLNGEPARSIGKSGEVVTVRVNPSNFKDYLQTR